MKNLAQQPIYTFFISAIDAIKEKVEQEDNSSAHLALSALHLRVVEHESFADYQHIVELLCIEDLLGLCINMLDNNNQENIKQLIMQYLDRLKASAHFLNFLECNYTSKDLDKIRKTNKAMQFGTIFKEIRRDSDCSGHIRMSIKEKQEEPLASPSEDYCKIIEVYYQFINRKGKEASQAQAMVFPSLLFNDLIEISKNSNVMSHLVGNESNFFNLGEIYAVVKLINEYKNEFQQQIAQSEEASSSSQVPRSPSL
jgi:hypothetical protein